MIEAGLELLDDLDHLLEAFLALPPGLRPVHFSNDEKVRGSDDVVDDSDKLANFVARSASGFFLLAPGATYSIRIAPGKSTICDCFFESAPALAKEFLIHMAPVQPKFGFSCVPSERESKNRLTVKQGVNTIQSWVGRDLQKYIPGFYWLTVLSDDLAKQHDISLSMVEEAAVEHIALEGRRHLFRFYENPEDWVSASNVVRLYASLPGVFNIETLKAQLPCAKNVLELNGLLRNWK